jgi:hypothetical protein
VTSLPIVGVHGIRCYRYYAEAGTEAGAAALMSGSWSDALAQGIGAGANGTPRATHKAPASIEVAYYSHLLHKGTAQGPDTDLRWLTPGEQDILAELAWDLGAPAQFAQGWGTVPVRQIARWLTEVLGDQATTWIAPFCREVDAFLADPADPVRGAVRDTVAATIAANRCNVVVAHSLGSVVAYETLHRHPELKLDLLLTIGSPLGLRHVVMSRLDPRPAQGTGKGTRPPGVARWINIADRGDIVAAAGSLAESFDGVTQDRDISIGQLAWHAASAYLAHPQVAAHLLPYRRTKG